MKIKREINVLTPNAEYEFKLTPDELKQAHGEFEEMFGNSPLYDFIKQEVPFRLTEILGVDERTVTPELVKEIARDLYAESDVMFDYDRLDRWMAEKYDEYSDGGQD